VRGRALSEYSMPTCTEATGVKIAQLCNLDIECLAIRGWRNDLYSRHSRQAERRRGLRWLELPLCPLAIW
jgi:hypothetical protein